MNFTQMLESYKNEKLKALSKIVEEPTEEQFNKEVEEFKKKDAGKIVNKKIDDAAVQAVEVEGKKKVNEELAESKYDYKKRSMTGPPPPGFLNNTGRGYDPDKNKPEVIGKDFEERLEKAGFKKLSLKKDWDKIDERALTDVEDAKKENVVMAMKGKASKFKEKYGDRWKNVLYATATKIAKEK